ncbi:glycoside hydrolase family 88 protein [Paenibacillus qinlingensis]|uniref:Unsaturated chondroitin disaccharide hydrolase n=1 Tax=Paenibacillus qinlingensis TaxID=1837343 RepID=A0ABU1NT20_9BACL|nr:glycoside hydrolase family 88 protein [Paenibacillus qinlingensis]MDR6550603.1 unsaturated chondroitin disaccharide hydrolase [Paenibacillus qinlingensis]
MANTWVERAWEQVVHKIEKTSYNIGASFPNGTENGRYVTSPAHDWVAGFWPGILWLVYGETNNERLKTLAVDCERQMSLSLWEYEHLHHDMGFMFGLSSIKQYEFLADEDAKRHALMAANLLAGRFNPVGSFIRAWPNWGGEDHSGWAIIDCMMNLPLLYWASATIADPRYRHVAEGHADMVLNHFMQQDGSVHHIVAFDPETGACVGALAGQGYAADSAWSRGAAWALYGFALSYRYTGKEKYLAAAKRVAHFFLDHLPADKVPYWDFRLPDQEAEEPRDSSAAAIAASGLLEISALGMGDEKLLYQQAAEEILYSLAHHYADWQEESEGLLLHATGYFMQNIFVDTSLIYGDYYFVEALLKLKKLKV